MVKQKLPAAKAHIVNLRTTVINWKEIYSLKSCLVCSSRCPEHIQPCGHGLCDVCVRIYGQPNTSAEYHFDLDECPLCGHASKLIVKQLPPTAFYRALAIDGGGVGGVFSLEALRVLEGALGCPLHDGFDYTIGTSSGKRMDSLKTCFTPSPANRFDRWTDHPPPLPHRQIDS